MAKRGIIRQNRTGPAFRQQRAPQDASQGHIWFDTNTKNYTIANGIVYGGYVPIPEILLNKSSLTPSTRVGEDAPSDTFTIQNTGDPGSTLNYTISDDAAWLTCVPSSGSSVTETDTITVQYDTDTLPEGTYTATITVSDPIASNNPQTITVVLEVSLCCVSQDDFEDPSTLSDTSVWECNKFWDGTKGWKIDPAGTYPALQPSYGAGTFGSWGGNLYMAEPTATGGRFWYVWGPSSVAGIVGMEFELAWFSRDTTYHDRAHFMFGLAEYGTNGGFGFITSYGVGSRGAVPAVINLNRSNYYTKTSGVMGTTTNDGTGRHVFHGGIQYQLYSKLWMSVANEGPDIVVRAAWTDDTGTYNPSQIVAVCGGQQLQVSDNFVPMFAYNLSNQFNGCAGTSEIRVEYCNVCYC